MEWPWVTQRCILCLDAGSPMSRAHLIPAMVGGFVWSRSHCTRCNSRVGSTVEAGLKRDDSVRYAVEHALAGQIPDISKAFAHGQSYFVRDESTEIRARFDASAGDFEIGPKRQVDGSLIDSRERARHAVETTLRRSGATANEIEEALARFDSAEPGALVSFGEIAVRHGTVERFHLPFDGEPVNEAFAALVAFHLLALKAGPAVYEPVFDDLRESLRAGEPSSDLHVVERGITRNNYQPSHRLGIVQVEPHVVIFIELFGVVAWRVHFDRFAWSKLSLDGLFFDLVETKLGATIPPARDEVLSAPPRPEPPAA